MRASVILAALAALAAGSAVAAAPHRTGQVRFVSVRRTFLDAGRAEGLAIGATVTFMRGAKPVGSCAIDRLGDHTASCAFAKARVKDTFALPDAAGVTDKAASPPPQMPTRAQLDEASAKLRDTDVALVDFHGADRTKLTTGLPIVSVTVGQDMYITFGGDSYQQTRLELSLNGVSIRWAGFRAYAHITALLAEVRPAAQRFRPTDFAQIYVWETAFTSREVGRPYVISIGRIWPYHAPGLTLVDGGQVGWRSKAGTAEVGVYGGTIPDMQKLYPSLDRWTSGLYYAHTFIAAKGSALRLLSTEGRLGVRGASGPGPQLELEWALMAALSHKMELGAQFRASLGAGDWRHPAFDAARISFGIRPVESVRVLATFRYLGPQHVDYDAYPPDFFATSHMVHATVDITYDPRRWISLMLQTGLDRDTSSSNGREYFGPEITFPNLGSGKGSLALGYREEFGWYAGRVVYLQGASSSSERYRVVARASYLEDRLAGNVSGFAQRELGLFAFAEGRVVRWLSLRASAVGRVQLNAADVSAGSSPAAGLTGKFDVIGSY